MSIAGCALIEPFHGELDKLGSDSTKPFLAPLSGDPAEMQLSHSVSYGFRHKESPVCANTDQAAIDGPMAELRKDRLRLPDLPCSSCRMRMDLGEPHLQAPQRMYRTQCM